MQIGTHLKAWRSRESLSQSDAAAKIGVKQPTVSAWESGTLLPDAKNLRRIASVIGVSADELLADEVTAPAAIAEGEDIPPNGNLTPSQGAA